MKAGKSLVALSILCGVVAAYVFLVNLVVANERLFANQQFPIQNNQTQLGNMTSTTSLGASCSYKVGARYGILPVHSQVFGDLRFFHTIFMWCIYPIGLALLMRANEVVLLGLKGEAKSDLVYGVGCVTTVFLIGVALNWFPLRLLRDLGEVLRLYSFPTFAIIALVFILRLCLFSHPRASRRLAQIREEVW